jgi:class 3 adenylate cyclase/tetratricopeptide (TPR) repeat protein
MAGPVTMQCPRCQHENRDGRRFCSKCGTALAAACLACGFTTEPGDEFCGGCGARLGTPLSAQTKPMGPDAYTPRHLAEKILTSKAALEGERKQVTVLFADLKGSTELLAERDPEEGRKLLDPVLERMMEAVHHYEGTVNQVMGDGIMALFGAPIAHEDHALRACYAALRMQRRVSLYADEIQRAGGTPVQIRVGLNSGEVVVRSIGNDLRMDYTAVGQTTHLAARMEQMAKPGSTLVTGDILKLAEGYVQVRPLGAVPVKGLEAPTPVYELIGSVPARSRLQASAARGLTRFVGREGELQQLAQALDRAAEGHGQVVAVVGEAGVGKSRLAWEFTRSHRIHGWLTLESGSVSYGKATPYLPVIELLKGYFRIQERDDPRVVRERVAGKLLMLDRALEPLLAPLLHLLDVPVEDAAWEALDRAQRRQRTLDAVKHLLLRESQVQPLLVLFEDLHWIDSETQAVLDGIIESLPTARILLLVNFRPEYEHPWGRKTYYLQLRIDPLPPQSAGALLDALLGEDRALEPLKQRLIERTEGNPFFLEESVRTLAETQVLVGERGAYRLAKAGDTWQIPATAQAIVAARIDRLPPEDKWLLQAASVVGKNVPFALLHAVADVPEDGLRRGLSHLQAAEFLYETSLFPDLEYTFKHALTHEVAYGSLLQDRRRAIHARIVEAIETLHTERLTEHVERLAHHAFRGELWDKALAYLRQAGMKAFGRSANREAVAGFEQALAALAHLPGTRETMEQGIDVRLALRNALWPLGRFEPGFAHLQDAERLATTLDDRRRLGWIAAYLSEHTRQTGHAADAPPFAERALTIARGVDDLQLAVAANYYLGSAYFVAGDYRRVDEYFSRILELLEGDRFRERCGLAGFPVAMARFFWAFALAERGDFARGLVEAGESVRLAEILDHPYTLINALRGLSRVYGERGNFDHAVPPAERGLALSREHHLPQLSPDISDQLGYAYALSGRTAEGLAVLEEARGAMEAMGMVQWRTPLLAHLGEAYLLTSRREDALAQAERCLALARERGHRGSEAWALRLLGEIAAHDDGPDMATAEAHYGAAVSLATELGMRPLLAHCHLGLGNLCRGAGNQAKAEEHLATATAMYREMDMRFWLHKAESSVSKR